MIVFVVGEFRLGRSRFFSLRLLEICVCFSGSLASWLGTDEDAGSGADVIGELVQLYEEP